MEKGREEGLKCGESWCVHRFFENGKNASFERTGETRYFGELRKMCSVRLKCSFISMKFAGT
jgi:hypothetical protein